MKTYVNECSPANAAGKTASSRQSGLDVMKCVAALLVVYIHFGGATLGNDAFSIVSQICNGLERVSVPLFFMITGYYYPSLTKRGRMRGYLHKLVKLTLGASLFYFLLSIFIHVFHGDLRTWLTNLFTWERTAIWILLNDDMTGFHLWYLYAVLYDVVILLLLDRFGLWRRSLPVIALIFLGGLALYFTEFHRYARNFLFFGLPYVATGRLIAEGSLQPWLLRWSDRQLAACFITCNLLVVAEVFMLRTLFEYPFRNFYLFTLPLCLSLFAWVLRHPTFGAGSIAATVGQKYSAYIYILHVFIGILVLKIWGSYNFTALFFRPLFIFLLTTLLTTLLAHFPKLARKA